MARAEVRQTIDGLKRPTAAVVKPGGTAVLVTEAPVRGLGLALGEGAVRRYSIRQDGSLADGELVVAGLDGPVGLTVLRAPVGPWPEGTLVVLVGSAAVSDAEGRPVREAALLRIGLQGIDPVEGSLLEFLPLGPDSAAAGALGHPVLGPTGLASAGDGTLYVADSGAGGEVLRPSATGRPGIWRLTPGLVARLFEGGEAAAEFIPVNNIPGGLYFDRDRDALLFVTSNSRGPSGGAIFRLGGGDFSGRTPLETLAHDLRALNGVVVTERGQVIAARAVGELTTPRSRLRGRNLRLRPDEALLSPGQPAVWSRGGASFLAVPERAGDRIRVFRLAGNL
ncbi:MAG: hypothetical protein EA425_11205 [Puniceicoccaceae bacterium]|nr:MAG: hypothetical protein EA425_11205 [Puniceicoccaceae bacterium]